MAWTSAWCRNRSRMAAAEGTSPMSLPQSSMGRLDVSRGTPAPPPRRCRFCHGVTEVTSHTPSTRPAGAANASPPSSREDRASLGGAPQRPVCHRRGNPLCRATGRGREASMRREARRERALRSATAGPGHGCRPQPGCAQGASMGLLMATPSPPRDPGRVTTG